MHTLRSTQTSGWLNAQICRVQDLADIVQTITQPEDCPGAARLVQGVPIYDCQQLRQQGATGSTEERVAQRLTLMAEWARVWRTGPGILVLQGAFEDLSVVDATTQQFRTLIEEERLTGSGGDHFGKPGANDRVWNALEKLCLRAPQTFAAYYGNDMVALACEAWLGPAYQMTSQVNCVNPGGEAQMAHRDYHLGFLSPERAQAYPAHVHQLSPLLTLQGAVAHVDMPLVSGPTVYLPHSQKYASGYLVAGNKEFQAFFDAHQVQLPLSKGDAVFFNPALMHAAGHNRSTGILRMANLLQVSSAFGRAMESVDRVRMCEALYPALQAMRQTGQLDETEIENAIAACAEGYAFPTNLDRDPPLGGLAPQSQQSLMMVALQSQWPLQKLVDALRVQADKKLTS